MIRIINVRRYSPLAMRLIGKLGLFRFPLPDLGEKIK